MPRSSFQQIRITALFVFGFTCLVQSADVYMRENVGNAPTDSPHGGRRTLLQADCNLTFSSTSLTFDPIGAGDLTEITLMFTLAQSVSRQDEVILHLPGFFIDTIVNDDPDVLFTSGPLGTPTVFGAASWQGASDRLVLVYTSATSTPAGTAQTVLVSRGSGMRVSRAGFNAMLSSVAISYKPNGGSETSACPLDTLQDAPLLAGSVVFESADGLPAIAAALMRMHLRLNVSLGLLNGDEISVTMYDFFRSDGGDSSQNVTVFGANLTGNITAAVTEEDEDGVVLGPDLSPIRSATWTDEDKTLRLSVDDRVEPGSVVRILVDERFGIRFPVAGAVSSSWPIEVGITASWGLLEPRALDTTLDVPRTSVRFSHPVAGAASNLIFRFTPRYALAAGDVLALALPTECAACASVPNLAVSHSAHQDVTSPVWLNITANSSDVNRTIFAVSVFQPIPSLLPVTITVNATSAVVPGAAQVRLPSDGIRPGDATFTVNLLAPSWPAGAPAPFAGASFGEPEQVDHVQAVGSFARGSALSFAPAQAGAATQLLLSLLPSMELAPGDTLSLTLPAFSLRSGRDRSDLLANSTAGVLSGVVIALWDSRAAPPVLRLTATQTVPRRTQLDVLLDVSQGVVLPAAGVSRDDPAFTLSSDAADGPVLAVSAASVQAVGAFTFTALSFPVNRRAGLAADLQLTLIHNAVIQPGESISVVLPGFLPFPFEDPAGTPMPDVYSPCDSTETSSTAATTSSTPALTGTSTAATLSTPAPGAFEGYVFSEVGGVPVTLVSNGSIVAVQSWALQVGAGDDGLVLVLNASGVAAAGSTIQVDVPASLGLSLPTVGVARDDTGVQISTNAIEGPASLQPIQSTEAVGYCLTSLEYWHPVAGGVSEVQFQFECWSELAVGESITFSLPGFERAVDSNASQVLDGTTCFSSTNSSNGTYGEFEPSTAAAIGTNWTVDAGNPCFFHTTAFDSGNSSLTLRITNSPVAPRTRVRSVVRGLRLPSNGLRRDQANLTFSTDAVSGPVVGASVQSSPGLGAFGFSFVGFGPPVAGATADVVVVFSLSAPILPRESVTLALPGFDGPASGQLGGWSGPWTTVPSVLLNAQSRCESLDDAFETSGLSTGALGAAQTVDALTALLSESYVDMGSLTSSPFSNASFRSRWMNANGTSTLEIQALDTVVGHSLLLLVFPRQSFGTALPAGGVSLAPRITLSSQASYGLSAASAVQNIPSVGVFSNTRITYTAKGRPGLFEGELAQITFSFTLSGAIQINETLTLTLPGFTRSQGSAVGLETSDLAALEVNVTLNATTRDVNASMLNASNATLSVPRWEIRTIDQAFGSFVAASWDEGTTQLVFTASKFVPARQTHAITVPASEGIALSSDGLNRNDDRLTIATEAVAARVTATPVQSSPLLQPLCGLECGGLLADRTAGLDSLSRTSQWDRKALPAYPALPQECPSIQAAIQGDCRCGDCTV